MSKKEERRGLFFSSCRALPEEEVHEALKPPHFTREEKPKGESEAKPGSRMIAFGGGKSRFQVEVEARREKKDSEFKEKE